MVIIVRAFPDAGRGKNEQPEQGEKDVCRNGFVENGVVLVVVVDDEHPHQHQPTADAGEQFRRGMHIPEGSGVDHNEQGEGAERTPAALPAYFHGKRPGGKYEFSARSHEYNSDGQSYEAGFMEIIPGVYVSIRDATTADFGLLDDFFLGASG